MQLANIELNERVCESLSSHNIVGSLTYLFLKGCFQLTEAQPNNPTEKILHFLEHTFEISKAWFAEHQNEIISENDSKCNALNFEAFIKYLIQCKQSYWKPKIVLVKSENPTEQSVLVLVGLTKIIHSIALTTYRPIPNIEWQPVYKFAEQSGIYCEALVVSALNFTALQALTIIPIVALKNPIGLWDPKKILELTEGILEKEGIFEKENQKNFNLLVQQYRYCPINASRTLASSFIFSPHPPSRAPSPQ